MERKVSPETNMVVTGTCVSSSEMERRKKKKDRKKNKQENKPLHQGEFTKILNDGDITRCNKINFKLQPVISKDSRHIICPCGSTVAVFRRKTGVLENLFTEHQYDVANIYINHQDPTQVISCSSNEILVWDYEDAFLSKKYDLSQRAISWYLNPKGYEDVYFTRIKGGDKIKRDNYKEGKKVQTELVKWNITGKNKCIVLGTVSKCVKCVAVSRCGEYVVFSYKNKLSIIKNSNDSNKSYTFDDAHICCIAMHPKEVVVATGDKEGKVVLWYNLGEGQQISTKLHWHSHPIDALVFASDGNYLMSGAKEGVLVTWQLETQKKTFLPHLGGGITHLVHSEDEHYVGILTDNNMMMIVETASSSIKKTIKYLAPAYEILAGLSYHSKTDCLVLNGRPDGVLQFFKSSDDDLKLSVDEREDRILPNEIKLKFWKFSAEDKNYFLNTLVDPPHKGSITSIVFRPAVDENAEMVVTTSEDGDVKTWNCSTDVDENGNLIESWQIQSVSNHGRNCCHYACFSHDGSLLAIAFSVVTLWNPINLSFKRCLQYNAKDDKIKYIEFGHQESSQFLLGFSSKYLIVWDVKDINSSSIIWILEANISLLKCDPFSKYCAVLVKVGDENSTNLYLIDPAAPPPVNSCHRVNKGCGDITSMLFAPKKSTVGKSVWNQIGELFLLTKDTEILSVKRKSDKIKARKGIKTNTSSEGKKESVFENIFGSILKNEKDIEEDINDIDNDHRPLPGLPSMSVTQKMITTPTNLLPSANIMCKAYIKSLLIPTQKEKENEETAMETEVSDMENALLFENDRNRTIHHHDNRTTQNEEGDYVPSKELLSQLQNLEFEFVINALE